MQHTNVDDIDLRIIKLAARDSRSPYKDIASTVGISLNATKDRINRMVSNGAIEMFAVRINPVIFVYEKECILTLIDIGKTIKEQEILNMVSLVGDVIVYVKHLKGTAGFVLYVSADAEGKMSALAALLKPVSLETIFVSYRSIAMRVNVSDLNIMKSLLADPRMPIDRIANKVLLSSRLVKE